MGSKIDQLKSWQTAGHKSGNLFKVIQRPFSSQLQTSQPKVVSFSKVEIKSISTALFANPIKSTATQDLYVRSHNLSLKVKETYERGYCRSRHTKEARSCIDSSGLTKDAGIHSHPKSKFRWRQVPLKYMLQGKGI